MKFLEYIRSVIEIIVQLTRLPNGERIVSEIYFAHASAEVEGTETRTRRGRPPKPVASLDGARGAGAGGRLRNSPN